jgi:DNA primase
MKYNQNYNSKLNAYFHKQLGMFDYKHGWLKGTCPECGKVNKFGVNLSKGSSNCFVCGYNKRPFDILMDVEGIDTYSKALSFLESGKFEGYQFKEEKVELRERKDFYLPDNFKLLNQGSSQLAQAARSYIKGRGFDIAVMSRKGWGYCGEGTHFGYAILPFYSRGRLIYYHARNFLSTGPKYNNPNIDITGVGKAVIWYNPDALELYDMVYITEGVFNAETMGDNAIASGGKFVSRYQLNQLIKSTVKRFVILLDPDAIDKAIELALALVDFKKVKVVVLPENSDTNSLGKNKTMQYIYNTRYQDRRALLKLKNSL